MNLPTPKEVEKTVKSLDIASVKGIFPMREIAKAYLSGELVRAKNLREIYNDLGRPTMQYSVENENEERSRIINKAGFAILKLLEEE